MNRTELVKLGNACVTGKNTAKFSEYRDTFAAALAEYLSLPENYSYRDIERVQPEAFEIIEEILDEHVPTKVKADLGTFADVRVFGRGDQPVYNIKNVGKNRVAYGIEAAQRGGIYKARRLYNRSFTVTTETVGTAYMINLEEILNGSVDLAEIVALISEGFEDIVYFKVVSALRATYSAVPANNKATASGFDQVEFDKVVRTVSAYGSPTILCFRSEATKILNYVSQASLTQNVPSQDFDDIRTTGYVQIYKGMPVVVLPNYFTDETNSTLALKENDIFVLPASEKPVKVAFCGDTYIREVQQPAGGAEWHAHRMLGVAIFFNNSIGIYRDSASGFITGLH